MLRFTGGGGVCRRYPLSENSRPLNTLRTLDTVPLSIEDQEQAEVIKWFRATWPEHEKSLRSSMNGLPRHGRQGAILWRIMQRLGCQKGEPDFALLLPKGGYGALVIEHKGEGQSHKLTPEQTHHLEYHESIGNCAVSTRGVESFKAAIIAYMEL